METIKAHIPAKLYEILSSEIKELRPAQKKAVKVGLLDGKNVLVCTPTASGKTLIAELASMKSVLEQRKKAVYIVPLKALATEKYREFKRKYEKIAKIALSIGNLDASDPYLADYDIIIITSEKLDSLLRHHAPWLMNVGVVVIDEIHLLNDPGRGPTLEVLITLLRRVLKDLQIVGLSATIGNPEELAEWLGATLVEDSWRPVKLKKGVYLNGQLEFIEN
jgi:helicase